MSITLRGYQQDAVDALFQYFEHHHGNPLLELPTGAGKSIILAKVIQKSIQIYEPTQVIMLTHVKELIEQNYRALRAVWGSTPPAGIYSAGLNLKETQQQIIFASIQSVAKNPHAFGKRHLIFIDEAHRIPKSGTGQYLQVIEALLEVCPNAKVVGLTATPYRMDGGYLHKGKDRLFTDIAYMVGIRRLIAEGHLSPVVSKEPGEGKISTENLHMRMGDFNKKELGEAAMSSHVEAATDELVALGREQKRKSWLIFGCNIEHITRVAARANELGVVTAMVTGDTNKALRAEVLQDFKDGKIQLVVNCDVLTTGFDAPGIDLVGLMRPTESTSLYVQMVGRGLRVAEGKANALVLDYGGNVRRHGPIDNIKPSRTGRGGGEAPVKECNGCGVLVDLSHRECPECGMIFISGDGGGPAGAAHDAEADTTPIMGLAPLEKPRDIKVEDYFADAHEKVGSPDSMKVTYVCGVEGVNEWVCFEHLGFARKKAVQWWIDSGGADPCPTTVDEALSRFRDLPPVERIHVRKDGKYDRVVKRILGEKPPPGEPAPRSAAAERFVSSLREHAVSDFDETPF